MCVSIPKLLENCNEKFEIVPVKQTKRLYRSQCNKKVTNTKTINNIKICLSKCIPIFNNTPNSWLQHTI